MFLSTGLHATLTGHTVNISILLFSRACECGEAGGSEPPGRHVRVAVRGAGRAAPASAPAATRPLLKQSCVLPFSLGREN